MCKNEFFQSSEMKKELFKVHGRKTKLMYSLGMKTIFWPIFYLIFYVPLYAPPITTCHLFDFFLF